MWELLWDLFGVVFAGTCLMVMVWLAVKIYKYLFRNNNNNYNNNKYGNE